MRDDLEQVLGAAYHASAVGGDRSAAVRTVAAALTDLSMREAALEERGTLRNLLRMRPRCCHVSEVRLAILDAALGDSNGR